MNKKLILIKTLQENNPSERKELTISHGLSFYIEINQKKILFDCGSADTVCKNAEKMNVDLSTIDYVILSHSHYDHAGGYPELLKKGLQAKLIIGDHFWEEKYAVHDQGYTYLGCGFNHSMLEHDKISYDICKETYELLENCWVVSNFERVYEFEQIPERFVKLTKEQMITDDFADEVALVLKTNQGLVVFAGCSHPGILNILTTIKKRFACPVFAVFGGTHLVEADEERIKKTGEELKNLGIKITGLNHCTGGQAIRILKENGGFSVTEMRTGDCFLLY